jgi:hypothetical protein
VTAEERAVAVFTGCDIKHDSCLGTCVDCVANAIREARRSAYEGAKKIADTWAAQYPEDIFPRNGTSLDAKAGSMGRHVAKMIADDIIELAEKEP